MLICRNRPGGLAYKTGHLTLLCLYLYLQIIQIFLFLQKSSFLILYCCPCFLKFCQLLSVIGRKLFKIIIPVQQICEIS